MQEKLSNIVNIKKRFFRSINIGNDLNDPDTLHDYVITNLVEQTFSRIINGLVEHKGNKAWTITGPYGTGKSAFSLYLSKALSGKIKCNLNTFNDLSNQHLNAFPILVTGYRTFVTECIINGIIESIIKIKDTDSLAEIVSELKLMQNRILKGHLPNSRAVIRLVDKLNIRLNKSKLKTNGIILILDELGKVLEYSSIQQHKNDLYLLQEIAEYSARNNNPYLLFIGILHQPFEYYQTQLLITTSNEWAKIQGRFEDIQFHESPEELVRLLASAIDFKPPQNASTQLKSALNTLSEKAYSLGIRVGNFPLIEFKGVVKRSYPLHPSVLVLMPYIFKRFSQNERSLFSYLTSNEPFSFREFISISQINENIPFIRLPDLYDYFRANLGSGFSRIPQAQVLMEAADIIESVEDLSTIEIQLIKTISILQLLDAIINIKASQDVLLFMLN